MNPFKPDGCLQTKERFAGFRDILRRCCVDIKLSEGYTKCAETLLENETNHN